MCKFFSAVVTKDKVLYNKYKDAHEDIIEQYGLNDMTMEPNFVRVELIPKTKEAIFNKTLKDWAFKVDQDLLPEWFNVADAEKKTKETLLSFYDEIIFRHKKNLVFINDMRVFLKDSQAELHHISKAELYGESSAILFDGSSAHLHNKSSATLHDKSSALLYEESSAKLYDKSSAMLWDKSSAKLYCASQADLCEESSAELYDKSKAELRDDSFSKLCNPDAKIIDYRNI